MSPIQKSIVGGLLPVFLACAALAQPKGGPIAPDPGPDKDKGDKNIYIRPDLVVQFKTGFGCLPDSVASDVRTMIQSQFPVLVDVRPPLCSLGMETIGAWVTKAPSAEVEKERDRGVAKTQLLRNGETFAVSVGPSTIGAVAMPAWNKMAKRLNSDMQPDPNGDTTLNSFKIETKPDWQPTAPGHLVTTVGGVKDTFWGDVKFWLTIDQTFAANTQVKAQPPTLTLYYSGSFPVGSGTKDPPAMIPVNPGAIVAGAFPTEIPIPNLVTEGIDYQRVTVDYSGIVAAGSYKPVDKGAHRRVPLQRLEPAGQSRAAMRTAR